MLNDITDAKQKLIMAWPHIINESRLALGSELFYQAVVYHCLRTYGQVPIEQLGMNVKMYIANPVSQLFRTLDLRKHSDYQGGFEPIPDICLFSQNVQADWRRRNKTMTLASLLLAIEVKASERSKGRLRSGEIIGDIEKLAAHRQEAEAYGSSFFPVMMVIDTAPLADERMTNQSLLASQVKATEHKVGFLYVSPTLEINTLQTDLMI